MDHLHERLEALEHQVQTLHQQTRTDAPGREYYVALSGNDANPGTFDRPFRTIAKGVSTLQAGDVLNLRHGVYVEAVVVAGKHGTPAQPILIRSYPGEHAYLDGSVSQFRQMNNTDTTAAWVGCTPGAPSTTSSLPSTQTPTRTGR